jgi:FKBP-type peptidyl-prolyl cis-trans isomerase
MMPGELKITDHVVGTGAEAVKGKTVQVHYAGRLEDGTEFDNSFKRGEPIRFRLGVGQVIEGWDKGIAGLKVGGKRTLVIPSEMGYGEDGAGDDIPPNATLIFEVELVAVS